jgi:hypothetical protein
MSEVNRVTASSIKAGVESGSTLLICAYDDDAKFKSFHLEGAIPLSEFKVRLALLEKDAQIVFYCA